MPITGKRKELVCLLCDVEYDEWPEKPEEPKNRAQTALVHLRQSHGIDAKASIDDYEQRPEVIFACARDHRKSKHIENFRWFLEDGTAWLFFRRGD